MLTNLCLIIAVSTLASANWINRNQNHVRNAPPLSKNDVLYYANQLENEENAHFHIDKILIPRVSGQVGNQIVRNHITDTLIDEGWQVEVTNHTYHRTPVGKVDFYNVIATLDPTAPRRLVLACHYDSKLTPKNFLGATDSAVPCAQMLNLAHTMRRDLFANKHSQNDLTLQLIFFDGEEAFKQWTDRDSLYGSRGLADKWQRETYVYENVEGTTLTRINLFVLLDLIGTSDTGFKMIQTKTKNYYNRLARIEKQLNQAGALENTGRALFSNEDFSFMGNSVEDDHKPFQERGVPILHLISFPFPKVWHKISDNKANIDNRVVKNLNKILRTFVAEVLKMDRNSNQNQ